MAIFNANILMRELRKASGLSQAEAAEGICARQTISAIERGERKPDWFTFSNVMKKFKVDPTQYYSDVAGEDEIYIYNKQDELGRIISAQNYDKVKEEIDALEQDERWQSGLGYQFLLTFKSILYGQGNHHANFDLALKYSYEYLRLFRPDFDAEKINEYFLSDNDIKAIGRLALAYMNKSIIDANKQLFDKEYLDKTIRIRYMLLENIERNYSAGVGNSLRETYLFTLSNLAAVLTYRAKKYEEAIEIADKGMNILLGLKDNPYIYFRLLASKAKALMLLGKKEEGEECFKRLLLFSIAIGNIAPADMRTEWLKNDWTKTFGFEPIDISVNW